MKKMEITLFEEQDGHLNGLLEVNSDTFNISYGNAMGGHGMQCAFTGDSKDYDKLLGLLDKVSDLVREINKFSQCGGN